MSKIKKTKKSHIKRCIKKVLILIEVLIILFCVVLTSYILLLDRGIIKLNYSNDNAIEENGNEDLTMQTEESLYEESYENISVSEEVQYIIESDANNINESNTLYTKVEDTIDITPKTISIETIGEVDEEVVKIVEEKLKLVPQELIDSFVENGWTYYVTVEDIRKVYYNGKGSRIMSTTDHTNHLIKTENRKEAAEDSTIHEMGHYLESAILKITGINPSLTDEFKQIYLNEGETFKDNIEAPKCVSNEREFFAETFYYYIVDQTKCTPKAMEYVQTQLNILKEERSN